MGYALGLNRVSGDGSWHDRVMTKMSTIRRLRRLGHGGEDGRVLEAAASRFSIYLYGWAWTASERSGDMRMYV